MNEIENRKIDKINETKSWIFKKINKIDKQKKENTNYQNQ